MVVIFRVQEAHVRRPIQARPVIAARKAATLLDPWARLEAREEPSNRAQQGKIPARVGAVVPHEITVHSEHEVLGQGQFLGGHTH